MKTVRDDLRKLNKSASQIARETGMLSQTVSAFLRGKGLTRKRFDQLCRYLGYDDARIDREYFADDDRSGQTVGHWLLLHPLIINSKIYYRCRCVCGKERNVQVIYLLHGKSLSCGCRRADRHSERQKLGKKNGIELMQQIHTDGLCATYDKTDANKNSQSGVRGVCPLGNKWRASITAAGKYYHLGTFENIDDAIAARKTAEDQLHGPLAEKVKTIKEAITGRKI